MPSWIQNEITISAYSMWKSDYLSPQAKVQIRELKEFVKQGEEAFSFQAILPMPSELENTTGPSPEPNYDLQERYGADNWYTWCCKNWGTKWDCSDSDVAVDWGSGEDIEFLHYTFDTPWGPPVGVYRFLKTKFPDLKISWLYIDADGERYLTDEKTECTSDEMIKGG